MTGETNKGMEYPIVDSVDALNDLIERAKKAQEIYSSYTQEEVDKIFKAAATGTAKNIPTIPKYAPPTVTASITNIGFIFKEFPTIFGFIIFWFANRMGIV